LQGLGAPGDTSACVTSSYPANMLDSRDGTPALDPASVQAAVQAYQRIAAGTPDFAPHATLAFEQQAVLGEGGMGVVVRVLDRRLGRLAAVKLIRGAPTAARIARFRREAAITAGLEHPSIPPVYEVGTLPDGLPYLAMRLIAGRPMSDLIDEHHRDLATKDPAVFRHERHRLIEVLVKVAEAVAYAHGQGVVHRDLKPQNVLVGRYGEVSVMDWGLAKRIDAKDSHATSPALTAVGAVLGTPGYVSPEQADGRTDPRADVYALGAMLAEVLTGSVPSGHGCAWRSRTFRGDVRAELDAITAAALAADVDDRTEHAEEVAASLRAWLLGEEVPGYRYGVVERVLRAVRRRPARVMALLGLFASLGLTGAFGAALQEARRRELESEARSREVEQQRALAAAGEREAQATRARLERALDLLAGAEGKVRRGERDLAFAQVEEALALESSRLLLRHAARIYQDAREFSRAKALLERAIEASPPGLEELYQLHLVEVDEADSVPGARTPALDRLEALSAGQENAIVLASKGEEERIAGRPEEAVKLATRALELDPDFGQAANVRGAARYDLGDLAGAIEDFRRAVATTPRHSTAWGNLGYALSRSGEHEEGLAAIDRSLALRPDWEVRINRGNVLQSLGRFEEAIAEYDRVLARLTRHYRAFTNRGNAKLQTKAPREALADYDASIAIEPRYPDAYFGRGYALSQLGDHAGALTAFEEQVRLAPRNAQAWAMRGREKVALGRRGDGLQDLERALEVNPRHPDADGWRNDVRALRGELGR
jgi:tetratricopeptide (TPR) repeat protein